MIVIGTRGSKLALVQAHWVSDVLSERGLENEIKVLKTKGDIVKDRFDKMEGKGFFTKEIEDALRAGEIDLAVHCLKDLPTEDSDGLKIVAITEREDPFDVLISSAPFVWKENGEPDLNNLNIGTSSNRRVQALAALNPSARFTPIRGNVPTRIGKMEKGDTDAVVLARAGINRLDLDLGHLHVFHCKPPFMAPAPGQGALALQTRESETRDFSFFHHQDTAACVAAERKILNALEGGCQLPLGVLIEPGKSGYTLDLFLGTVSGEGNPLKLHLEGPNPMALAEEAMSRIQSHQS